MKMSSPGIGSKIGDVFIYCFALVLGAAMTGVAYMSMQELVTKPSLLQAQREQVAMAKWPSAPGRLYEIGIRNVQEGRRGSSWVSYLRLKYRYPVGDRNYSADDSFGPFETSRAIDEKLADLHVSREGLA